VKKVLKMKSTYHIKVSILEGYNIHKFYIKQQVESKFYKFHNEIPFILLNSCVLSQNLSYQVMIHKHLKHSKSHY
jgi:hypothetical protein